ncbi:MAG: Phage XkdN-like protein [Firmicutes bacterium ADurb.Bin193]|nr:MAG: Phage XkdN-like protein [Firmicutes bacterium ADurb.Bin193]
MSKLIEFLAANPVDDITSEIYPSKRFADAGLKFKIKAVTGDKYSEYQKQALVFNAKGKSEFNSKKYNELIIFNNVIEPSFVSEENIKKAGCSTPTQFLYKTLLAGEINNIVSEVQKLSGFDEDFNEFVEEAKN